MARDAGRRIRELAKEIDLGPFDWEKNQNTPVQQLPVIIDSSVTIAWFMPDEYTVKSRAVLDEVIEDGAVSSHSLADRSWECPFGGNARAPHCVGEAA